MSTQSPTSSQAFQRLLEHPALWRVGNAARADVLLTGFAALDDSLPGGGWPRTGLIEILPDQVGSGELYLLLPLLAALTCKERARWCTWVTPPYEPYAPALAAHGLALDKMLMVRTRESFWAVEQALASGASDIALGWIGCMDTRGTRRLQLAAERGRALGVLFRSPRAAREPSHAVLRIQVEQDDAGIRLRMLKSRGGRQGWLPLSWGELHAPEEW
jgi:hypothetical protein